LRLRLQGLQGAPLRALPAAADQLDTEGDPEGAATWSWIARAIEQLANTKPPGAWGKSDKPVMENRRNRRIPFGSPCASGEQAPLLSAKGWPNARFLHIYPERLFQRLVRDFSALCSSPSEDGVISVVLPLFHLREWVGYRPKTGMLKAECGEEGCGYTARSNETLRFDT
jgi:hypothetical protein